MSDQLFAGEFAGHSKSDLEPRYGLKHFVYLAMIGAATIGWLWFIAWAAMQAIGGA